MCSFRGLDFSYVYVGGIFNFYFMCTVFRSLCVGGVLVEGVYVFVIMRCRGVLCQFVSKKIFLPRIIALACIKCTVKLSKFDFY